MRQAPLDSEGLSRARLQVPPRGVTQFSESDGADFAASFKPRARLTRGGMGVVHFLGSSGVDFRVFSRVRLR